jgi:ATP/maltotriose-dependent transcriptional regulator MalT
VVGRFLATLFDLPAAQEELEQAQRLAQDLGSSHWRLVTAADLVSVLVESGSLERAEEVLTAALQDETPPGTVGQRRGWCARAEFALAQGDQAQALEITERLLTVAVGGVETDAARTPYLAFMRGEALVGLGRSEQAKVAYEAACAGAVAYGAPYLLWRVHLALGDLARRLGDRTEANREYATARAAVDALAVTIEDEAQRQTFLEGAQARLPRVGPRSVSNPAEAPFGGLSEREREVLRSIAEGMTDREIAEILYVSPRTVTTHVSNILAKLGVKNRAEAVAFGQRHGLI